MTIPLSVEEQIRYGHSIGVEHSQIAIDLRIELSDVERVLGVAPKIKQPSKAEQRAARRAAVAERNLLAVELWKQGRTTQDICKAIGLARTTVYRILGDAGLPWRVRKPKGSTDASSDARHSSMQNRNKTTRYEKTILQLHRQGMNGATIAKRVGVSHTSIGRLLAKHK